jgi:predicted AlkP superfamily phosphohydrolase/phosphomutase
LEEGAMAEKVVVIGLDGFNPDLVFLWRDRLPVLSQMMEEGIFGRIRSTVPPITPQAWTSVLTGKNPGQFGFWNFTYRRDFSYGEPEFVNSTVIRTDTLYDILPRYGKKAAIINVPVSYPPPKIPGGFAISSFLTPSSKSQFTHPAPLKEEVTRLVGEYIIDASTSDTNFRRMDKDLVLERIYRMDEQRFELLKHFIREKDCDFIFAVIMGSDRMPHLFYRYFDKEHRNYREDPKYRDALKEHYRFCDARIGEVRALLGNDALLLVLSDHSVQRLDGRINLNEWLVNEAYMKLKQRPSKLTPLARVDVDWSCTRAWATGYTGQLYVNLQGREAQGVVPQDGYDSFLDELSEKLTAIPAENGRKLQTRAFKRDDIHFGKYAQYGPDLFIYFDECRYNISELIGYESIYSYETLLGPDDGGHGEFGYFAAVGPGVANGQEMQRVTLLDVAPTVLDALGLDIPPDMEGNSLLGGDRPGDEGPAKVYSQEEEEEIRRRLAGLGYV